MGHHGVPAQRELFTAMATGISLPPEVMRLVLPLLEQLLTEVMAAEAPMTEGTDDQDHA